MLLKQRDWLYRTVKIILCSERYEINLFISLTQNGISHIKFGSAVTRCLKLIGTMVTFELLPAQQRNWQQIYTTFSGSLRSIPEMGHNLFPAFY